MNWGADAEDEDEWIGNLGVGGRRFSCWIGLIGLLIYLEKVTRESELSARCCDFLQERAGRSRCLTFREMRTNVWTDLNFGHGRALNCLG